VLYEQGENQHRVQSRLSGKSLMSPGGVGSLAGMGARFIGVDRDQVFLMPPSVRDWVPEGHLVWTVLDAVGELDLSLFYGDYRRTVMAVRRMSRR
jgi:hypothetical protein